MQSGCYTVCWYCSMFVAKRVYVQMRTMMWYARFYVLLISIYIIYFNIRACSMIFFDMSLTFGLFCQMNKIFISTCTFLCAVVYKIIQNSQNLMSGVLKRTLTRVCNVKYRFCYQNQNPPSYTIWKVTSAIWLETSTNCIL